MREEDLQLLVTLDDPWNAQECDTFYNHQTEHDHRADDMIDIIIITARGDDQARARALAAGAVALLNKPFKEETLLGAVSPAPSPDRRG